MTPIAEPQPDPAMRGAANVRCQPRALRLGAEDGFAVIVVLAMLVIGLALGAVAVAESLSTHASANRDQRERRAQQATDAGIATQLYTQSEQNISSLNLNGGPLQLSTFLDCNIPQQNVATGQLTGGLITGAINAAGVCPASAVGPTPQGTIPVQALGNHTFDQSEFIPGAVTPFGGGERVLFPKIVSLGWDDNGGSGRTVYQRQLSILAPIAPLQTIEAQGNLTMSGISAVGISVASTVYGNVSAVGNLTTPAALVVANIDGTVGGAGILGTATYGGNYSGGLSVPAPVHVTQPILRQPVTVSPTKASCPDVGNTCSGISTGYNTATDTFVLNSGVANIGPGDYVLCSFDAEGGTVNVNPTASTPVRIFIDSPTSARCNSVTTNAASNQYNDRSDPTHRGNFTAKNGLVNGLLALGGVVASSGLQIYVVGDQNAANPYDNATSVTIGGGGAVTLTGCGLLNLQPCITLPLTQAMVVYAPTSQTTLTTGLCVVGVICTGGVFEGSLVGDTVNAQALTFTESLDLGNFPLYNGVQVFHPVQNVQCSAQPNSGGTTYTRLQGDATIDTNGC